MNQNRLYSLDMMKFVAAIFITNSHFQPLYEGVNTAFATFGVQGNALFFFVAGYLLMMGFEKHKGYGTREHMDIIKELGPTPIHRISFLKNIF